MKSGAGFTLIELLVVISVTGILSAIGIAAFVNYSRQQQVTQTVNDLKNNLRIAQSKALTQEIPSGCNSFSAYELKFADDGKSYSIYPICSDMEGLPKVTTNFPSQVTKVQGPAKIRFKILTGAVDGAGTVTLSGFDKTMCVEVTSVGRIQNLSADLCSSSGTASSPTSSPSPTPTTAPTATPTPAPRRVFVTSTKYNGNLGGLSGADAKCQARADAASLGGTWKPWVTDGALEELGSPPFRFNKSTVPYVLVDGTVIANDWTDLITLKGSTFLRHAINLTEFGQSIENPKSTWTGTKATGGYYQNAVYHCDSWSSAYSGSSGVFGLTDSTMAGWSSALDSYGVSRCNEQMRLYCFEQ